MTSDKPNTPSEKLNPRIVIVWMFILLLFSLGLLTAGIVLSYLKTNLPFWLLLLPATIVFVLGTVYVILKYRVWRYGILKSAIHLNRGVIIRVRTLVPLVRIQHVDTRRGPVDRILGLSKVVIYTAGSRGADVVIPGLQKDRADSFQDEIKDLILEDDKRWEDAV